MRKKKGVGHREKSKSKEKRRMGRKQMVREKRRKIRLMSSKKIDL
jgi:hypothetical protein